jgi:hypothetical protein
MLEAGQIAQRLSGLSKRLHRRFNGSAELLSIGTATDDIERLLNKLHQPYTPHAKPPQGSRLTVKRTPRPAARSAEKEPIDVPNQEEPDREEQGEEPQETPPIGLAALDRQLQEDGEDPLGPPPGEPQPDHRPPARMVPLAEMPYDQLKAFAKSVGVQTFRVKRENIQSQLIRKGHTTGPVGLSDQAKLDR